MKHCKCKKPTWITSYAPYPHEDKIGTCVECGLKPKPLKSYAVDGSTAHPLIYALSVTTGG